MNKNSSEDNKTREEKLAALSKLINSAFGVSIGQKALFNKYKEFLSDHELEKLLESFKKSNKDFIDAFTAACLANPEEYTKFKEKKKEIDQRYKTLKQSRVKEHETSEGDKSTDILKQLDD